MLLDDENICSFIQEEPFGMKIIISLKDNKYPHGISPLNFFSPNDVYNNKEGPKEDSKRKTEETIPVNIGTNEEPKTLQIGSQCLEEEKKKFLDLFHEFSDVFT